MASTIIFFFIGFLVLIQSARWLVDGATSVAKHFNISQWAIGMIIVGIGTSIPELAINLASVWSGGAVGIGTIIGSNTFNLLFTLGLSAILTPLVIFREWISRDFIINILAVLVVAILIFLPVFGGGELGVSRSEGGLLLIMFATWVIYTVMRQPEYEETTDYKVFTLFASFILVVAGVVGVFFGGRWIVEGAEVFARALGVSEYIIGLTIVGIGTSLPELSVSLVATFKKNASLAIGNIIGSNIFCFLGIVGITATLGEIRVPEQALFDILVTLGATVLLFLVVFLGKKNVITRLEGALFVTLYIAYIFYTVF